jgi:hypothetical protein
MESCNRGRLQEFLLIAKEEGARFEFRRALFEISHHCALTFPREVGRAAELALLETAPLEQELTSRATP